MLRLFSAERPLVFFGGIGVALMVISTLLAIPLFSEYLRTGLVPRLPTAVLATGIMLSALLGITVGLVLDTVARGRREMKMLAYLRHAAPH